MPLPMHMVILDNKLGSCVVPEDEVSFLSSLGYAIEAASVHHGLPLWVSCYPKAASFVTMDTHRKRLDGLG